MSILLYVIAIGVAIPISIIGGLAVTVLLLMIFAKVLDKFHPEKEGEKDD